MRRFILLSLMLFAAAPAMAADVPGRIPNVPPIVATYDIYVGGIHLVTADILFQEEKGKYHSRVNAQTYGFWHRALPWETVLDSRGKIVKDKFVPLEFYSRDVWKGKPKVTKLHFKKDDVVPEFDPPSHDENREIVTQDQRHGSLDPVTALLQMLAHVAVNHDCNVTVPVFDGKRRFDVTGADDGDEEINEADYGIFKGDARTCDAGFKMISGEWNDRKPAKFWQKSDTEAGREPFHIWLGSVSPELPEMAVRMESGSVFGLIIVHLSNWRYATSAEIKS
ncbi:MAG TPA: DUF3108 domain-containing protein [Alphaproteobacteria bacterium]|nr:DUF3108 domain-containing protein [Alphaproteobacteria bacterium]